VWEDDNINHIPFFEFGAAVAPSEDYAGTYITVSDIDYIDSLPMQIQLRERICLCA
jgi:hypothetical protein